MAKARTEVHSLKRACINLMSVCASFGEILSPVLQIQGIAGQCSQNCKPTVRRLTNNCPSTQQAAWMKWANQQTQTRHRTDSGGNRRCEETSKESLSPQLKTSRERPWWSSGDESTLQRRGHQFDRPTIWEQNILRGC